MDYTESYFEVEWVEKQFDEFNNKKEIIFKEEFKEFSKALDFYRVKKTEGPYIVRLISVIFESNNRNWLKGINKKKTFR